MTDDIFAPPAEPDQPAEVARPTEMVTQLPPTPPAPRAVYTPPRPSVVVPPAAPAVRKASKTPWLITAVAAIAAIVGSVLYIGQKSATADAKAATSKVEQQLATANKKADEATKSAAATKDELSAAKEDLAAVTQERDDLTASAADAEALRACITQMDDADYTTTENFLDFMKLLSDSTTTQEDVKAQATTIKDSINAFADLAESCKTL